MLLLVALGLMLDNNLIQSVPMSELSVHMLLVGLV